MSAKQDFEKRIISQSESPTLTDKDRFERRINPNVGLITSADANGDGTVDIRDLLRAKKQTAAESGNIKASNEVATRKITDYLLSDYDSAESTSKEFEDMKSADLNAMQTEIDDLDKKLKKANEYVSTIKNYENSQNTAKRYSGRQGFVYDSRFSKGAEISATQKELNDYLSSIGYSNVEDLKKDVDQKKVNKKQAQRIQDRVALSSVADRTSKNYDADFEKYASKGDGLKNQENPWYESGHKNQIGWLRDNPKYMVALFEKSAKRNGAGATTESILLNDSNYVAAKYMTDDEYRIYCYYLGKGDKKSAEKYLSLLEESLKIKQGADIAAKKDSTFSKYSFGYIAGIDQFTQGIINLFNKDDNYIPATGIQNASAQIRSDIHEKHGIIGQGAYDLITTTSNMLPSIATSIVADRIFPGAGAVTGGALIGASAAGNAYSEFLNQGYEKGQARTYSALVGASEAGLSYVIGGIGALGGKLTGKTISSIVDGIDNGLARFAIKYGLSMASEGFEEAAQEVLDPFFENFALGYRKNDFSDVDWREVAYSGVLGALSAGLLEGVPSAVSSAYSETKTLYNLGKKVNIQGNTKNMLKIAAAMPKNTEAYRLSQKYNSSKISNTQLGSVQVAVNEAINKKIDAVYLKHITERLKTLGVENADTKAKTIYKKVQLDESVSAAKSRAIMKDEKTKQVYEDLVSQAGSNETETNAPKQWLKDIAEDVYPSFTAKETVGVALGRKLSDADISLVKSLFSDTATTESAKSGNAQNGSLGLNEPKRSEISTESLAAASVTAGINKALNLESKTDVQKYIEQTAGKLKTIKGVIFEKGLAPDKAYIDQNNAFHLSKDISASQAYSYLFMHEFIHTLENRNKFSDFKNFLFKRSRNFENYMHFLLDFNGSETTENLSRSEMLEKAVEFYIDRYSEEYGKYSAEEQRVRAENELICDYLAKVCFQEKGRAYTAEAIKNQEFTENSDEFTLNALTEMMNEDRSFVRRIIDFIKDLIDKIKGNRQYRTLVEDLERTERYIKQVYDSAEIKSQKIDSGNKYYLNPKFAEEYDLWDKNNKRKVFRIGTTSKALQSIGIANRIITWDGSKIIKILSKHSEMTSDIIKQVPNIIENPIVIMQSKQIDSRITMFGEVYTNNKPVLVVLELNPNNKGLSLDNIKIASAYGKDNAQRFIDTSEVLYVDKNEKRVSTFKTRTGLQLPVGGANSKNIIFKFSENVNTKHFLGSQTEEVKNGNVKYSLGDPTESSSIKQQHKESTEEVDKNTAEGVKYSKINGKETSSDGVYGTATGGIDGRIAQEGRETFQRGTRRMEETAESFKRRIAERTSARQGEWSSDDIGTNNIVLYKKYNGNNSELISKTDDLKKCGYKIVLCSGDIYTNSNGVTVVHPYAVTSKETGEIFVSDNIGNNIDQTLNHEIIHSSVAQNRQNIDGLYYEVLANAGLNSDGFSECIMQLKGIDQNASLKSQFEELLCYLYQAYMYDPEFAKEKFGSIFKNWETVASELEKFNNSIKAESNDPAFSVSENGDAKYSLGNTVDSSKNIDNYTEKQYNDFGWASYNDVITSAERETLLSHYADYKHNKDKYPTTKFGEAVIHSSDYPNVIAYIKGTIGSPQITKIVRITNDDYCSNIKEVVLYYENRGNTLSWKYVEETFGEKIFDVSRRGDFASFRELKAGAKGRDSQTGDFDNRTGGYGTGGIQQNSRTDRAGDLNNEGSSGRAGQTYQGKNDLSPTETAFNESSPDPAGRSYEKNATSPTETAFNKSISDNSENVNTKHSLGSPIEEIRYNPEKYASWLIRKYKSDADAAKVAEYIKDTVKYSNITFKDSSDYAVATLIRDVSEMISEGMREERSPASQEFLDSLKGKYIRVSAEDMGDISYKGYTLKSLYKDTGVKFVISENEARKFLKSRGENVTSGAAFNKLRAKYGLVINNDGGYSGMDSIGEIYAPYYGELADNTEADPIDQLIDYVSQARGDYLELDYQTVTDEISKAISHDLDNSGKRAENKRIAEARREGKIQAEIEENFHNSIINKMLRRSTRNINHIDSLLVANSNQKHVPESARSMTYAFMRLMAASTGFKVFGSKDINLRRSFYFGNETIGDIKTLTENFKNAVTAYLTDNNINDEGAVIIKEKIEELQNFLPEKSFSQLNADQIETLTAVSDYINDIVNERNEAFINGKRSAVADIADRVISDLGGMKSLRIFEDKGKAEGFKRLLLESNLPPVYVFKRLGPTFYQMYFDLIEGQNTNVKNLEHASRQIRAITNEYNYEKWRNDSVKVDIGGKQRTLSIGQALALYATLKRERSNIVQKAQHTKAGGIVLDPKVIREFLSGQKQLSKSERDIMKALKADTVKLADGDFDRITAALTEEQKNYADGIVKFMSTWCAELGNSVTMKLYNVRRYLDKYYFPYATPEYYKGFNVKDSAQQVMASPSFSHVLQEYATSPVLISDFTETALQHINRMIAYNAFAVPLNTLNKVLNFGTVGQTGTDYNSVQAAVYNAYGEGMIKTVKNFLLDVNNGVIKPQSYNAVGYLVTKFRKNAVAQSLSVWIQQPTAILRAAALIDVKHILAAKLELKKPSKSFKKALLEEMHEYAPVSVLKEKGTLGGMKGASDYDWVSGKEYDTAGEKAKAFFAKDDSSVRDEVFGWMAQKGDQVAWRALWLAVKKETAASGKYENNSKEFFNACGQRFTEIVVRTQVYDSVLSRSENLRDKSYIGPIMSFMNEPTLSMAMMEDAAFDFLQAKTTEQKRTAGKTLRRVALAVIGCTVLSNIAKTLITAPRDDDEDKSIYEKYINKLIGNILDDLNPFAYFPISRDIVSKISGYDVERPDMAVISKILDNMRGVMKDDAAVEEKVKSLANLLGYIFDIPVSNIWRDVETVSRAVTSFAADSLPDTVEVRQAILESIPYYGDKKGDYYIRLRKAAEQGDEKAYNELKEYLLSHGAKEANFQTGLLNAFKKSDKVKKAVKLTAEKLKDDKKYNSMGDDKRNEFDNTLCRYFAKQYMEETFIETPRNYSKSEARKIRHFDTSISDSDLRKIMEKVNIK